MKLDMVKMVETQSVEVEELSEELIIKWSEYFEYREKENKIKQNEYM
jgi:hypothetical protein